MHSHSGLAEAGKIGSESSQRYPFALDDNLQRSGRKLHVLFNALYPSQSKNKQGKRIGALLWIRNQGEVNKSRHQQDLIKMFGITTRQALYPIINTLIDIGILGENGDFIFLTEEGENLLDSLLLFHKSLKGELHSKIDGSLDGPYYELSQVNLSTNGFSPASYFWLWNLNNNSTSPIKKLPYSARSGGTPSGNIELHHSTNISKYEITNNLGDSIIFDLYFGRPIPKTKSVQYWYSYDWPGNYDPDWKPWTFTYRCQDFPVINLDICIINLKEIEILPETITHNEEIGKKVHGLKSYNCMKPEVIKTPSFNFLIFRASNVPVGSTIQLKWEFNHKPA